MVARTSICAGICLFLTLVAGCEPKKEGGGPNASGSTPAPAGGAAAPAGGTAAPAAAGGGGTLDPKTVASPATISGTIKVEGTVPPPEVVNMASKPECVALHAAKPAMTDNLIVGSGNTLKDCFVYVKKGLEKYKFDVPAEAAVIDQKGCMYTPHVLPMRVNQDLKIVNSDTFNHNINVKENNPFNLGQPAGQTDVKPKHFKKVMVPTKVQCDIHGWMGAYACVVDNPYYSLTGEDGKFEIKGLPAGKYTIAIWHESYPGLKAPDKKEIEIEVKDGETKTQDFTFTFSK